MQKLNSMKTISLLAIGLFLIVVILFPTTSRAQDIIIKSNGDEIKSKVLELTSNEIKYKESENSDGATHVINKSEVFMIKYSDGSKVIISTIKTPETENNQNQLTLKVENYQTKKQTFFVENQTVRFQLRSHSHFVKARITGIKDSTLSFHNKKIGDVTYTHLELQAFKVPRSQGRKAASLFLMVVGGLGTIIAASSPPGGTEGPGNGVLILPAIPIFALGFILIGDRKINLDKSWISTEPKGTKHQKLTTSNNRVEQEKETQHVSNDSSEYVLLAENIKNHKQIVITIGQSIRYHTSISTKFEVGRISGISDKSISFQVKKLVPEDNHTTEKGMSEQSITIMQKNLTAIKIYNKDRNSAGLRKVGGILLMIPSVFAFMSGVAIAGRDGFSTGAPYFLVFGAAGIIGARALLCAKTLDLKKSWTLRTYHKY